MDTFSIRAAGRAIGEGPASNGPSSWLTGSKRLPAGPHGIPAELIERNQRERIVAAMAEVSSERGYYETTVQQVVNRAGVSSSTFYLFFKSLEDCAMQTFWELHERLMEELEVACRPARTPTQRAVAALHRSLELFAGDVPSARLMTVEILGAGAEGARCQHHAFGLTAERIGIAGEAGWGRVALASNLIARRVVASEVEKLPQLEEELKIVLDASKGLG